METDKHKTVVVFRVFPEGDVIALFPELPGDVGRSWSCSSYQHVGQHGSADIGLMRSGTRPAKPAEYANLAAELRRIGYNLEIKKRVSTAMNRKRMKGAR